MSKSLAPDQTDVWHKYMHQVKGIDFLMGYAVACSYSHGGSRNFCPENFQDCKVLGGGSIIFQVVHLLISMETYITCGVQWESMFGPPAFIRLL